MSLSRSLLSFALAGFLAASAAYAAPVGALYATPTPGLTQSAPDSPWRNVGYGAWADGHAGAQGVYVAVDVDPADQNRILTATQLGGLWLSEDAGKS